MESTMTVKALQGGEELDMGDNGFYLASTGEVCLLVTKPGLTYTFVMSADDARQLGKDLITQGWEALKRRFGPTGALKHALGRGDRA